MKKLYASALCLAICASSLIAAPHRLFHNLPAKKASKNVLLAPSRSASAIWRPVSEELYIFEDEWFMIGVSSYTYDNRGNVLTKTNDEFGEQTVFSYTYNDDNMVLEQLETQGEEGGPFVNVSKRTYVYDPIIKDYFIERMGYDWSNSSWVQNYYCEINDITRNSAGNITEIIKKLPYMNKMSPAYRSLWHYNAATGQADEYAYYSNESLLAPMWELYDGVTYKNIVWDRTNGQMTKDFTELFEGPNRVSRAEVYYDDELDGHIIASYSGEDDYEVKNTFVNPDEVAERLIRETIDENGSFRITLHLYIDENDELTEEPSMTQTQTILFDNHGNIIEDRLEYFEEGELIEAEIERYDYLYDANGNPTELTVSYYDEGEDAFIPEFRTVYGEYIDVTSGDAGIEDIVSDNNSAVEVYNLGGLKVADTADGLAAGLYIVRQGSSVSKIAIK